MARVVVAMMLGLLLAGCGARDASPAGPAPDGEVVVAPATARDLPMMGGAGCHRDAALGIDPATVPAEPTPVPEGFTTARVLRCREEVRAMANNGSWMISIAERADGPATELLAELRKPSDSSTTPVPCRSMLTVAPYFLLVDPAGRVVRPAVPTDSCRMPRETVRQLLDGMTFRTLSETPVRQVESPIAAGSGCSDAYKDMFVIEPRTRPGPAAPVFTGPVDALRICVYGTSGADPDAGGRLTTARVVDGAAAAALVAAFDRAGPAVACSAQHTMFAVVSPAGTAMGVVAELDGCRRLLRSDGTAGQLDEAGTAPLLPS